MLEGGDVTRQLVRTWNRGEKQAAAVLRVVAESPATSGEVAAELDIDQRVACAVLRYLWQGGHLARERYQRAGQRHGFLYRARAVCGG